MKGTWKANNVETQQQNKTKLIARHNVDENNGVDDDNNTTDDEVDDDEGDNDGNSCARR